MTPTRPYRIAAFTLIEMIVVITVIMLMMGTLMSGLATIQKGSDTLSTPAVIQAVHESCFRNARQFGSAGLVYGFTLDYGDTVASLSDGKTSANVIVGQQSAIAIIPWVAVTSGLVTTVFYHTATNDLFTDIGRQPLWDTSTTPARIYFDDKLRPSKQYTIQILGAASPGTVVATAAGATRELHVGYEPRTGFAHPLNGTIATDLKAARITDMTSPSFPAQDTLAQLVLDLYNITSKQVKNKILITYTGVIDAHSKL